MKKDSFFKVKVYSKYNPFIPKFVMCVITLDEAQQVFESYFMRMAKPSNYYRLRVYPYKYKI